jgi:hypothetical protein
MLENAGTIEDSSSEGTRAKHEIAQFSKINKTPALARTGSGFGREDSTGLLTLACSFFVRLHR